jgi:Transmembrane secretion effector
MVACDLIRLVLMLALALVAAADLPVVLFLVIAVLATAAATPYLPSVAATTPRLVAEADLPGANAARSAITGAGIIVGPTLGGVLLLLGSPALAFAGNAATFGLSAVCVLTIRAGGIFRVARVTAERPTGLLREVADGAAALRAHPAAVRLVGADIMCSLVYGMQTVLLILVARSSGLGLNGYGYLFAAIGAGALAGTSLASRAARMPDRAVPVAALASVGLPMLLLAVVHWGPTVIVLAAGAGAVLVEIRTDTGLQRMLPDEVFGRAYGLAIPLSIGGIGAGSLIAPTLNSTFGLTGALVACGAVALAYAALLLGETGPRAAAPTASQAVPATRLQAEDGAAAAR